MMKRQSLLLWVFRALVGLFLYLLITCGTADLVLNSDSGASRCNESGTFCLWDGGPSHPDSATGLGTLRFKVPYQFPPLPTSQWLRFATNFRKLDLYILEDVSGSMKAELHSIKSNLAKMLEAIACDAGETPEMDMCIPSVQTGAGEFGRSSEPWKHLKDIDANNLLSDSGPDEKSTEALLPTNAMGSNEKHLQAISGAINGTCASDPLRAGKACFRTQALRVIVLVSDEDFQEDETYAQRQALYDQMAAMGVYVVGVMGNDVEASTLQQNLFDMAGGNPSTLLVPAINVIPKTPQCGKLSADPFFKKRAIVEGPDSNASLALICGVQGVISNMPQDLTISIVNAAENRDLEGKPVDVVSAFIDHVEVYQDPSVGCAESPSIGNQGGYPAIFKAIVPGTDVCWTIHVKQNAHVKAAEDKEQQFTATAWIVGVGGVSLDSRDLVFVVPASNNPDIN